MIYVKNSTKCDNLTGTRIGETYKISFTERIRNLTPSYHYLTISKTEIASDYYTLGTASNRTGIKILHTGIYQIQFVDAYFEVSGGDNIVWAIVGSTRLGDAAAFVSAQYTADTKNSRISVCAGGITQLYEGEIVYCGVSKSSVHSGSVDFASYDDINYNGTLTVTYLGQNTH